jgi:uncharacterized protein with HEPN domain
MARDPKAYLWDAKTAADAIADFVAGRTFEQYKSDLLLRSAVERQFEIVGEALNQLSRIAPGLAAQVPDIGRIIAFRNILIHGYAIVDDEIVWRATGENLPDLRAKLEFLLRDASAAGSAPTQQ